MLMKTRARLLTFSYNIPFGQDCDWEEMNAGCHILMKAVFFSKNDIEIRDVYTSLLK